MPKCMWPHAPYCSVWFGTLNFENGVIYCPAHQAAAGHANPLAFNLGGNFNVGPARGPARPTAPRPVHEQAMLADRVFEEACRSVEIALDSGEEDSAARLVERAQREVQEATRLAARCGCSTCRFYQPRALPHIPAPRFEHDLSLRAQRDYLECCRTLEGLLDAGSPQAVAYAERTTREGDECRRRARQCGCQSCRHFEPKAVPTSRPDHATSLQRQRTFNASLDELERRLRAGESYEACRELHTKVLRDQGEVETAAGRCAQLGCGLCRVFAPRRVPALPAAPVIDRSLSAGSTAVVRQYQQEHPGVTPNTLSDIALLLLGVCIATRNGALTEDQKAFIKDLILAGEANRLAHAGFLMQVGRDNQVRPFPRPRVPLPASTEVDEWLGQQRLPDLEDTLRSALWRCGITSLGEAGQTGTVFSLRTHTATRGRVQQALGDTAWGRSAWARLDQRLQMLTMEDVHRMRLRCITRRLECY